MPIPKSLNDITIAVSCTNELTIILSFPGEYLAALESRFVITCSNLSVSIFTLILGTFSKIILCCIICCMELSTSVRKWSISTSVWESINFPACILDTSNKSVNRKLSFPAYWSILIRYFWMASCSFSFDKLSASWVYAFMVVNGVFNSWLAMEINSSFFSSSNFACKSSASW